MTVSRRRGVGYVLSHEQFPPGELIEFAVAAEAAGFDAVWASDHFHPWQDNQGHAGQAWLTLAAIGQRTSRVTMGTAVTCPIYRYHPAIVAQAFATLGLLYPGRVFLGAGTGEAVNEAAAGGGWGPYRERLARLREAIALIKRLWTGAWVTSAGPAFPVPNARIYDAPSEPVPVYVAASGPKSAAFAGELGDGWITDAPTLTERPEIGEAFRSAAAAAGKRPGEMPVLAELYAVVGDEDEALAAAPLWQFGPVMGELISEPDPRGVQRRAAELSSPERTVRSWAIGRDSAVHIRRIEELFAAGATQVYVHSAQPDQLRVIEFYGREVLPALFRSERP